MESDEKAIDQMVDRFLRGESLPRDGADTPPELLRVAEVFGFAGPAGDVRATGERATSGSGEQELPLPWERLGPYRLIERLGAGGMGMVFLAEQERLDRRVAIKVVRPELAFSQLSRERFRREALMVARLRHPNIVAVFDAGEDQGVSYLVMEHVPGRGLDDVLREAREREERVPIERALQWSLELARALGAAHAAGIVHRDVKPSNVRIGDDGRAMLLDFGLARVADLEGLSVQHDFRGSLHYASPEQITGGRVKIDARSDVFSLGVVLYECLAGRRPFAGETTPQVFQQILARDPEPLARIATGISPELESLVSKALRKDPAERQATGDELAAELERVLASPSALASSHPRSRVTQRMGIVVAIGAIVAAGLLWSGRESRPNPTAETRADSPAQDPGWHAVPRRLFGNEACALGHRLDGWRPTEGDGDFGDDTDFVREPAVIGHCRLGTVTRRIALEVSEFRLSGSLAPMPDFDAQRRTDVPTESAGLRLEWSDGRALALSLRPVEAAYRAELVTRERAGGEWRRAAIADGGMFDEERPLAFVVECTSNGVRAALGTRVGAPSWSELLLPASAAGSEQGSELVLSVDRGMARFIDFRLERRP